MLSDVEYVLCLDSIGKTDHLFLHVSKPPKEGTPAFALAEVECLQCIHSTDSCFQSGGRRRRRGWGGGGGDTLLYFGGGV